MRVITADNPIYERNPFRTRIYRAPIYRAQTISVTPLPRADAGLVALGVGQHPECGRSPGIAQCAARGQRGIDPRLRQFGRHVDVEVDPVAWSSPRVATLLPAVRPWRVHLLEPDR